MDIKETIREMIEDSKMDSDVIAAKLGMAKHILSRRINSGALTAEQFFAICDLCGAEARIVFKASGKEVLGRDLSEGRRVRRTVGGIVYDTCHAVALGNNFKDGTEPRREAYRDDDGNYFFADYYRDGDMIVPSNGDEVAEFLKKL